MSRTIDEYPAITFHVNDLMDIASQEEIDNLTDEDIKYIAGQLGEWLYDGDNYDNVMRTCIQAIRDKE